VSEATITRDGEGRGGDAAAGPPRTRVIFAGDAGDPALVSSSHTLDAIAEVRFHRGTRGAERRGDVLTLSFPDARMSSEHGRWLRRGARWLIDDPGSKNGTYVDGELVRTTVLHDGAVVELGHSFFVFRDAPVARMPAELVGDVAAGRFAAPAGLVTFSPALAELYNSLARLAATSLSLLVTGETGTGKEVVSRAIHALSERSGAFVAVNCGALPVTLIEAELFGHRRGAFSGAASSRVGLVRSSDGGTLFLDEIGELPAAAQSALLRVLQEREVLPLGEDHPLPVDLRVIAATLRDLDGAVADGRFRPDLYARIAGRAVTLPPLRERREDLGLLIAAMLAKHRPVRLAPAALRALLCHNWPRNVRELDQAIATAIALAPGDIIEVEHLPVELQAGAAASAAGRAAGDAAPPHDDDNHELRAQLHELLARHDGNVVAVAKALGKERAQIYRWVRRFAIDLEAFRRA
jgi:transcriptional regulator of acetoin/glycerol metabolism